MNKDIVLIIDIETYLYKAVTACKVFKQCETDRYIFGEYYDLRRGMKFIDETIQRLRDGLQARYVELVVGDKENFRKKLYSSYKANRPPKPEIYPYLLDLLKKCYSVNSLTNLEADDTCRIIFEDKGFYPDCDKIIVSVDKDFYSVPCKFYRDLPNNHDYIPEIIEDDQAHQHLLKQIIMGDTADNYKGIPNFGEKKAEKFLEDGNKSFADVCQLFAENGLDRSEYTMNKVCATIVGIDKYNFNTGEVNYR